MPWSLLAYGLVGLSYWALSGMAEGLASPRLLALPILLIAIIHTIYSVSRFGISRSSSFPAAGVFLILGGVALGNQRDAKAEEDSMRIGNLILSDIKQYHELTGTCPASFEQLYPGQKAFPQPALGQSDYHFLSERPDNCGISFDAPLLITCSKRMSDDDWYCDD
ncbi:hypothetical protein [Parvularcula marina]|uniref:hypothetical protein n=1 Tax=Parvularcula marina TaxID=2292771 RepID=UPI00351163B0